MATSPTPRSRRRSRPSASGANGSTSWDPIPAARLSRPEIPSLFAGLALRLHLLHNPPDQVGHRRLDSQALELGRDLASVIGGMVDNLPEDGPRGEHRCTPAAAEGSGSGQV